MRTFPPLANDPPTVRKLVREDWDFDSTKRARENYSGCNEKEIFYCFEYEFEREVALMGASRRALPSDERLKFFWRLFKGYFPATPWLLVPPEVRSAGLKDLRARYPDYAPIFRVSAEAIKESDAKDGVIDRIGVGNRGLVHVTVMPIAFSWQYSNPELVDAFALWLEDNEPDASGQCKVKTPGKDERSTARKALKYLGALRVLTGRSGSQAARYTREQRKMHASDNSASPLYMGDESSWKDKERDAQKIVEGWFAPIRAIIQRDKKLGRFLDERLSDDNRNDLGSQPLDQWLQNRLGLSAARRILAMSPAKAKERLRWVCHYPDDSATAGIENFKQLGSWEGL